MKRIGLVVFGFSLGMTAAVVWAIHHIIDDYTAASAGDDYDEDDEFDVIVGRYEDDGLGYWDRGDWFGSQ